MKTTIAFSSGWYDRQFEKLIARKLESFFPEVQFVHVQDASPATREEAWSRWEQNGTLDIRISTEPAPKIPSYDITAYLEDGAVHAEVLHSDLLDEVRDERGNWYGLPFGRGSTYLSALFYNEEVFGKFGVPLPRHDMSWDETIELAKKVTGQIDGISYCGLDMGDSWLLKTQLGVTILDPDTNRPRLHEADCREYFRIIGEVYGIPGNLQDTDDRLFVYGKSFKRKGTVAMCIHCPECLMASGMPFQFGVATYPRSGVHRRMPTGKGVWSLVLHPKSEKRSLAARIIAHLVSEPFQLDRAAKGHLPALRESRYKELYGRDVRSYSGQSLAWLFEEAKIGAPDRQSEHEWIASRIVKEEMVRAVRGQTSWEEAIGMMETRIEKSVHST